MTTVYDLIAHLDPCPGSRQYLRSHTDPRRAWLECERGDWLIWLAESIGVSRSLVVRAYVQCAYPTLAYVPDDDDRPRIALETAWAWCDGGASLDEVKEAAADAAHASATAYSYLYHYAAAAAAAAAYSAVGVGAYEYASALVYAHAAAYAYGDTAAERSAIRGSAEIVRDVIPWSVVADRLRMTARRAMTRPPPGSSRR